MTKKFSIGRYLKMHETGLQDFFNIFFHKCHQRAFPNNPNSWTFYGMKLRLIPQVFSAPFLLLCWTKCAPEKNKLPSFLFVFLLYMMIDTHHRLCNSFFLREELRHETNSCSPRAERKKKVFLRVFFFFFVFFLIIFMMHILPCSATVEVLLHI